MNVALVSLVLTVLINVMLGLIVFLRNPKLAPNRALLFSALSLSIWATSNYLVDNANNLVTSQYAAYITFGFGFLSMSSLLLFTYFFPDLYSKKKWHPVIFWSTTAVLFVIYSSPLVVGEVTRRNQSYVDVATGPLYLLFIAALLISLILVGRNLYINYQAGKNNKLQASQSTIMLFGLATSLVLGTIANAILPVVTNLETSKFGPFFTVILVVTFSYAIIRHKLFDIKFVIVRALTYVLSIGLLTIVYGFAVFRLFDLVLTSSSKSFQQTFDIILAILLAFTYAPLINFFSKITNRIFYRDRYDAQLLVNKIGKILASEIDLDKVSHEVVSEVTVQMKIDKGEIVVFGEKQLFYENTVFQRNNANISQKELRKLGRGMLVRDELQSAERKEIMQNYGISVSVALRTSERFIGYLLLGDKKGGDIYNDEDLSVIKIIGSELSVAIQNALSYKEIQLFNETLAQRVRERTAQLRTANDQLRQLDQAKDEFISMASHQLRTPLTTVKGYASMLEEGDFGKLTREQHEKVDLTLDGANRMARLIDDLLNVSRMDANRFFLEVSEVDIVSLVAQELQQLQTLAESKKVKISYTPPAKKSINIRLDENKTRQVVMNLIDNAIHYSQPPAGGGEVQVSLELQKDHIVFLVRDNGIGVPAVVQKRLFTKMFRANNAKSARPDGTGLGLYLVKRVVEDEGGEIIFESTEGKGSTFGFRMPLSGVPKSVEEQSMKIGARVAAHSKS